VSSNLPQPPPASQNWEVDYSCFEPTIPRPTWRQWAISALLLCATIISTSFAGLFYLGNVDLGAAASIIFLKPRLLLYGVPFSFPVIAILLAHELGHFLACRYYRMRCTPPYFIPAPLPFTGTLGAFIKIRSRFPGRKALFDVGIAGPLAGFLFALPTLWIGIRLSKLIPKGFLGAGSISFGEPLLFRVIGKLALGYSPSHQDMIAHPMAMAAWVGLLATSLNLLPIWQLDGGHVVYSIAGRTWHKRISTASLAGLILVGFLGGPWYRPSYLLFSILLLIIGVRSRFYHPPTFQEEQKIGKGRLFLGILALLILVLSFIPVPISLD
jgi:membrane-associated protease RseP (regulator of RpoE activity)